MWVGLESRSLQRSVALTRRRAVVLDACLLQSEGEYWANFLTLIVRHGKSQVVTVELFRRPVGESRMRSHLIVEEP